MAPEGFAFYTTTKGADWGIGDESAMIGHIQNEEIGGKVRTGMSGMLPGAEQLN